MITLRSPLSKSTVYSDKVYVDYLVEENSKFTDKIVFILDGVKYEKQDLFGSFEIQNVESGNHLLRAYLVNKSGKIIVGSEKRVKFKTDDNVIFLKNKLSNVMSSQIPSFIKEEYDVFVLFLEKYYQFLEQSNNPNYVPFSQFDFFDVDHTPEILIERFRRIFIPDFPQELTTDRQTGEPLNIRNLIKRAIEFYQSKGTEKSLNFLFKILYDSEIEIFYPRTEIFVASGGLWLESKSVKLFAFVNEDKIRSLVGKNIYQKNENDIRTNTARVSSCNVYIQSPYKVAELFLEEVYGDFVEGNIYCDLVYEDAFQTFSFPLKRSIQTINLSSGGSNYSEGDVVELLPNTSSSGVGYKGVVSKVDPITGSILKIKTINFGVNYEETPTSYTLSITSSGGSGASGSPLTTFMCKYDGYYKNSKSLLGAKNFLQDNYYYQTHSYEIKTDVSYDTFKDPITRLAHPAGYKMFGKLTLRPLILTNPSTLNNVVATRSNFIGNYLPYRVSTNLNLRQEGNDLFPEGFNPDQPISSQTGEDEFVHDVAGYPIKTNINNATYSLSRTLPDVSDIYQKGSYWVVFPHPNSNLNTNETISSFLELTIEQLAIENTEIQVGDEF
jgi:hypothetical protein